MDASLLAYLTFTFVLVATPGSTTAVVVRNTLMGGRAAGLAAASGAAVANASYALAAGWGLAVIFSRWPLALTILRFAGAGYLGWLGVRSVYRGATQPDGGVRVMNANGESGRAPAAGGFRQGLAVNMLNPSIATFYLIVVPSFLRPGAPSWYFALLAVLHIALAFTCHGMWAVGLDALRRLFHPPLARRLLEGATGVALVALAVKVLVT